AALACMATTSSGISSKTLFGANRGQTGSSFCGAVFRIGRGGGEASFCEPAEILGVAAAPPSIGQRVGFCSGWLKIGVFEMANSALLALAISFSLGNVGFSRNRPSFNVCCTSATSASDINGLAIVATTFGNLLATAVISCT